MHTQDLPNIDKAYKLSKHIYEHLTIFGLVTLKRTMLSYKNFNFTNKPSLHRYYARDAILKRVISFALAKSKKRYTHFKISHYYYKIKRIDVSQLHFVC